MRKFYLLLTCFFLFVINVKSQNDSTAIPSLQFELALIDLGLDDIQDYRVLTSRIDTLHVLDIRNKSIGDLTGIEDFTMLTTLRCDSNNLPILEKLKKKN